MEFTSNLRNAFNASSRGEIGEYFTGNRFSIRSEMGLRLGYFANISMNFSYNHLRLPAPQEDADLLLIGLDLT